VLQRRPNTFAQTNLSTSFFACDKAADHTFWFARDPDAIRKSPSSSRLLGTNLVITGPPYSGFAEH